MPRASRKQDRPDPDAVYCAWTSGAVEAEDGAPYSFHAGERLRGDSPAVRAAFWCFVKDGVPASEWPNAHAGTVEQRAREQRIADNPFEVRVHSQPVALELDLVVCKKALRVGYGPNRQGLPEHIVTLAPG